MDINRIDILPNIPNKVTTTRIRLVPSTLDPSPASTKTIPMNLRYQPKPAEGKENINYNPPHHSQTNQVIMNRLFQQNHRNIINNLVFNAYSKKNQNQNQQHRKIISNRMLQLLPSQTTGTAVTTKMNTDMMISQDVTIIVD